MFTHPTLFHSYFPHPHPSHSYFHCLNISRCKNYLPCFCSRFYALCSFQLFNLSFYVSVVSFSPDYVRSFSFLFIFFTAFQCIG